MKHIYGDIYLESNGDMILLEKNMLSSERKIVNLTELSKGAK